MMVASLPRILRFTRVPKIAPILSAVSRHRPSSQLRSTPLRWNGREGSRAVRLLGVEKPSFVATNRDDEVAPISDLRALASEMRSFDHNEPLPDRRLRRIISEDAVR